MGIDVNTALYKTNGVDLNNVAKVSGEILKSANQNQATVQAIDYTKFNRATLGIDLYSNRTSADLQRQIALTQAGLYAQAVNVAKLNSNAAATLYSAQNVQKNVELTQSSAVSELTPFRKNYETQETIQAFKTADKHSNAKNGSNPFASTSNDEE